MRDMSIVGSRIILFTAALLVGGATGVLIRRKRADRLQTVRVDVISYSGGSVLFFFSVKANSETNASANDVPFRR